MNITQSIATPASARRIFPHAFGRLATFLIILVSASVMPLTAQQDVHATLIAAANRKAPRAFDLISAEGRKTRISDYRGKVVLLNFWATDCGGCVLEIPSFVTLQAEYQSKGFTAVGVSMDISYEDLKNANQAWERVRPFMVKYKINYPILMGDQSLIDTYGLKAFPVTYLIDKSGKIAAVYVGVVSKDNVESNIKTLLSEQ
jgi:peroxiredoxin